MNKIVLLGGSHLMALSTALARNKEIKQRFADREIEFVFTRRKPFLPNIKHGVLNENISALLAGLHKNDLVICSIGGNAHNILGLVNTNPKFDFFLPNDKRHAKGNEAMIVPYSLVRLSLGHLLQSTLNILQLIRQATPNSLFCLESPPPVPSAEHIENYPTVFKSKIASFGVASAELRYKLWRLHSTMIRERCMEANISFISVPAETQDRRGMLKRRYWNNDSTHGNWHYGSCVMIQIDEISKDLFSRGASVGTASI